MFAFIFFLILTSVHSDDQYLIRTIEKLPVHTEIINLRRLFLSNQSSDSSTTADFTLAKRDEFPYMFFLINHSSRGILTIRKEIDRDDLCRKRRCRCDTWCDLELEIFINNEQLNIEYLTIRIVDLNDHSPQFSTKHVNLTVVENAPIGAMIKLEPAVDYDQGNNGILGYSLMSSNHLPFSLRYDLIRDDLSLVINEHLDREVLASYQFQVLAYDGGNQTGFVHVYLTLDDVNDSPPKFDRQVYQLKNITENLPFGSILFRVHASDADSGINGELTYHLINERDCFEIDQSTGDIRVQCLLDYETKTNYQVEIEARDGGEGSKTDFCTVIIYLIDENDNYPLIDYYPNDFPIESNTIRIYLSESVGINSLILSFSIVDRDSGDNGRVTWKLDRSSSIPFELKRLSETTGELRTKAFLDRETLAEYFFAIEATDHGRPQRRSSRLHLHVSLLDENDHRPKFREENLEIPISEHVQLASANGYEIYRVQADDFDQDRNGEIFYSIVNPDDRSFQIDSSTGVIRAMREFDRKQREKYSLTIQAKDKGSPALASQANLTFRIISRNEHRPICSIEENQTNLSIRENSQRELILTRIFCADADDREDLNSRLSVMAKWQWTEVNSLNMTKKSIPFDLVVKKLNSSESSIEILLQINGTIDREWISSYILFLTVSDQGNPPQSTNFTFHLDIIDENDNCPQLHIESTFILINRDITSNDFALHLIASDNDAGVNGQITFELSALTSPSYVSLHANGTLFIQINSSLIANDFLLLLHIQIRDHGQPTPCLIVETLRLFIGSNRTDWAMILKNNDQSSLRPVDEQFQQGKRMAHVYPLSSTSIPFPIKLPRQIFTIFLGASILLVIVFLTMILCFVDRLHKRFRTKKSMIKSNGLQANNGKRIANSSPVKTRFASDDDSPTHHYTSFKALKSVVIIGSSSSSTSVDSTTRLNTAQNRVMNSSYSYTPIGTSDELMPMEDEDDTDGNTSGIELMMTTV